MTVSVYIFRLQQTETRNNMATKQLKQQQKYMAEEKKAAQGRQYQMDDEVLFGGWRDWLYLTVCSSHSVSLLVSQSVRQLL